MSYLYSLERDLMACFLLLEDKPLVAANALANPISNHVRFNHFIPISYLKKWLILPPARTKNYKVRNKSIVHGTERTKLQEFMSNTDFITDELELLFTQFPLNGRRHNFEQIPQLEILEELNKNKILESYWSIAGPVKNEMQPYRHEACHEDIFNDSIVRLKKSISKENHIGYFAFMQARQSFYKKCIGRSAKSVALSITRSGNLRKEMMSYILGYLYSCLSPYVQKIHQKKNIALTELIEAFELRRYDWYTLDALYSSFEKAIHVAREDSTFVRVLNSSYIAAMVNMYSEYYQDAHFLIIKTHEDLKTFDYPLRNRESMCDSQYQEAISMLCNQNVPMTSFEGDGFEYSSHMSYGPGIFIYISSLRDCMFIQELNQHAYERKQPVFHHLHAIELEKEPTLASIEIQTVLTGPLPK